MIFIWTPNGGPLQYISLALFVLQIASNLVFPKVSSSFGDDFMVASPLIWLSFTGLHLLGFALSPDVWEYLSESYAFISHRSSDFVPIIVAMVAVTTSVLVLILYPITVTINYDYHNNESQEHLSAESQYQQQNQQTDSYESELFSSSLAIEFFSFFVYFSIICTFFLFMHLDWRWLLDDDFYAMNDSNRDKNAMETISLKVQSMPIEEFITEEDVRTNSTVSEIKHMLNIRGKKDIADQCLERSDLVKELEKCRKCDDTCCICATAYEKGDPLRIWPCCGHQFHVECIDQWAYTFSSRRRNDHTPTCPLCKEPLK